MEDKTLCENVPGQIDEDDEEKERVGSTQGSGRGAYCIGQEGWAMPSFSLHALRHEKAARLVGLTMCMRNSPFPLLTPPSFDNANPSSHPSCQLVSLSAMSPAFENTSNT